MLRNNLFIGFSRYFKKLQVRLFSKNISMGENVMIDLSTRIFNNANRLVLGDGVYLRSISRKYQAAMYFPTTILIDVKDAFVKIGNNSRINGTYIHAQKGITIGSSCVIASGVNILDSNGHQVYSHDRTSGRDTPEEIIIGNNVWIGLNSIILKGSSIGDNSVVSAGSVVKGHFPANVILQGNPAVVIKTLEL
jgi:acetyltransferase-like isoleucine patch superfamily enzyme